MKNSEEVVDQISHLITISILRRTFLLFLCFVKFEVVSQDFKFVLKKSTGITTVDLCSNLVF